MKTIGNRGWIWTCIWCAACFLGNGNLTAGPQEHPKTTTPDAVKVKHHSVPKGSHSKSKTFTDSWESTQGNNPHKGKGVPDHWGGTGGTKSHGGKGIPDDWNQNQGGTGTTSTGGGKSGKGHTDNWIATDSKSTTSHKVTSHANPKPPVHVQPKSLK